MVYKGLNSNYLFLTHAQTSAKQWVIQIPLILFYNMSNYISSLTGDIKKALNKTGKSTEAFITPQSRGA